MIPVFVTAAVTAAVPACAGAKVAQVVTVEVLLMMKKQSQLPTVRVCRRQELPCYSQSHQLLPEKEAPAFQSGLPWPVVLPLPSLSPEHA